MLTHPAVAAVTDHNALFSAPDDTAPGVGVSGSPSARGGGGGQPGGGGGSRMPAPGGGGGGGWRGGGASAWHDCVLHIFLTDVLFDADAWRGSDQSSLITKALARTPAAQLFPSSSAPASFAVATATAAKQAARISEITATMERFDTMLNNSSLKLPDGGANVRAAPLPCLSAHTLTFSVRSLQLRNRREELAAELANLRAATQPLESSQSQPSQPSSDELSDALNAFTI